jgi:hypothetical protein
MLSLDSRMTSATAGSIFLGQHRPQAIVSDIAPPYNASWRVELDPAADRF